MPWLLPLNYSAETDFIEMLGSKFIVYFGRSSFDDSSKTGDDMPLVSVTCTDEMQHWKFLKVIDCRETSSDIVFNIALVGHLKSALSNLETEGKPQLGSFFSLN